MPLDGRTFPQSEPTAPAGDVNDLLSRPGQTVSIVNDRGESIIGQQVTTSALWQRWNITITTSSTSSVFQVRPQSVSMDSSGGANIVWQAWNQDITTSSTSTVSINPFITTSNDLVTFTGSSAASTLQIWSSWNHAPHVWQQMSPEDRAAHEARERQYTEQRAQAEVERKEAQDKAERLLLSCLTAEQRMTWRTRKCFYVTTRSGRRYRLDSGSYQGNVKFVGPDDTVLSSFCIHLRHDIPICDHLLAQKLMLEADEPTFMRIANETRRAGYERVSDQILAAA